MRDIHHRHNVKVWLVLAVVPIVLSVMICSYQQYRYGEYMKTAISDSEEWLAEVREMERNERQEVLPIKENEFELLGGESQRKYAKYVTPEYVEAEIEVAEAKSEAKKPRRGKANEVETVNGELAASDEMLEMDEEGNPLIYEVQPNEWLATIAQKLYGNKAFWGYIYDVNRDMLNRPSEVQPGMELYLPNREYFDIDTTNIESIQKAANNTSRIVKGQYKR